MTNYLKNIWIELYKILKRPWFYIGMAIASAISIGIAYQAMQPNTIFSTGHVIALFANMAEMTIFLFAGKILGDEYNLKTISMVFSNAKSRKSVILQRVFAMVALGIVIALISILIITVYSLADTTVVFELSIVFKILLAYILYSFCVGSFGILLSIISKNLPAAIVMCVAFFWVLGSMIGMAAAQFPDFAQWFDLLPFYSASKVLIELTFNPQVIIGLVAGGVVFTIISIIIIKNRDVTN